MKTIICFGDSNTFGYNPRTAGRFPEAIRWPRILQNELGDDYRVIEEGLNGRTTVFEDATEPGRSGIDYIRPCLMTNRPVDLVIVMLGTNDLKQRYMLTSDDLRRAMYALIRQIQTTDFGPRYPVPEVLLVAPPALRQGKVPDMRAAFQAEAEALSEQFGDLYREVAEARECYFLNGDDVTATGQTDGVHLEEEGHELLAEALVDPVREILADK